MNQYLPPSYLAVLTEEHQERLRRAAGEARLRRELQRRDASQRRWRTRKR